MLMSSFFLAVFCVFFLLRCATLRGLLHVSGMTPRGGDGWGHLCALIFCFVLCAFFVFLVGLWYYDNTIDGKNCGSASAVVRWKRSSM